MAVAASPFWGCVSSYTRPTLPDRCWRKCATVSFLDKILKVTAPALRLAQVIEERQGASPDTLKEIGTARHLVQTGRDVIAFFNVFNGVFPAVIRNVELTKALSSSLRNQNTKTPLKEFKNKKEESEAKYNQWAVGWQEQVAALIQSIGQLLAGVVFIAAFGLIRPIGTVEKHITKNIHPIAKEIAGTFSSVMFAQHCFATVGIIGSLAYQELAYKRAMSHENIASDYEVEVQTEYYKRMFENGLGLAEKGLELTSDIFHQVGYVAPPEVIIPIELSIALLSIAKDWIKE